MKVILGITGSIAAYKALELIRLIRCDNNEVKVILTRSALQFVTPLSCQTLSDNEVYIEQFALTKGIKHIDLNDWGDVLVIAPATANIIGKAANGIGDDLLSTALLSFQKPILFVPAMDTGMWENRIVKENVRRLKNMNGHYFLDPDSGPLASGKVGKGRFPELNRIYKKILACHSGYKMLSGKKILITGGRTEEDIDSVRVLTNRSTGMMARELYESARCREADVKLVLGETGCPFPDESEVLRVRTSQEMFNTLTRHISWTDVLIMAAAIGDYKPLRINPLKMHSSRLTIACNKNLDILKALNKYKKNKIFIGFSVEDKADLKRARKKLVEKGLDFVVSNPVWVIGKEITSAAIITKNGKLLEPKRMSKWELANYILDLVVD